ncbi:hypothetical protein C8F01DRAFT_1329846 [Mycena amicta]|nr:hypothetical protein C8F01DRAFT_1329846 [Mycena amicta]
MRTHLKDLTPETARYISKAQHKYEARIWTVDAYPDVGTEERWVVEVWEEVQTELGPLQLTHRLSKMITKYGTHARSTVVSSVRDIVTAHFHLLDGSTDDIKAKVVDLLTKGAFHHKDILTLEGFAQNAVIKLCIQAIWFRDSTGRGVKFPSFFSPISLPTLALLFTSIEFCIECFATGTRPKRVVFDEPTNKVRYTNHLKKLTEWAGLVPAVTTAIRRRLHDDCRKVCGAVRVEAADEGLDSAARERALLELQAMDVDEASTE